eukprot:Phypoly_transcript_00179.p1 GENE.Phypoly_transcript_00179~~Phypoly_transcript_00179.p1  ORF type:complete len:1916 (+),score=293.82 Phypoly_transcript_00179:377-6124(+)
MSASEPTKGETSKGPGKREENSQKEGTKKIKKDTEKGSKEGGKSGGKSEQKNEKGAKEKKGDIKKSTGGGEKGTSQSEKGRIEGKGAEKNPHKENKSDGKGENEAESGGQKRGKQTGRGRRGKSGRGKHGNGEGGEGKDNKNKGAKPGEQGEKGKQKQEKEKKRRDVLSVRLLSASGVPAVDNTNNSDPYCIVRLTDKEGKPIGRFFKTSVVYSTCNPSWGEDALFKFKIQRDLVPSSRLKIEVWDKATERQNDALIGDISYSLDDLTTKKHTVVAYKPQLIISPKLKIENTTSYGTILNFWCLYQPDGIAQEMDDWLLPRHERKAGKELLERAQELAEKKQQEAESDEDFIEAMKGSTLESPQSQLVRVFVSSTFTDTEKERNLLMEDVYPFMQRMSRILGMEFETVDMRWGVRDVTQNAHNTSSLCMSEIEKCLKKSMGPAFLCILGDKYGYRPFPARIAKHTLDKMWTVLCNDLLSKPENPSSVIAEMLKLGIEETQKWTAQNWQAITPLAYIPLYFKLDKNSLQPTYQLMNLKDLVFKKEGEWYDEIFPGLQILLRRAAQILSREQANSEEIHGEWRKFEISVTEEEVMNGILCNEHRAEQSICVLRKVTDINSMESSILKNYIDLIYKKPDIDDEAVHLLSLLKQKVANVLGKDNVIEKEITINEVNPTKPGDVLETEAGNKYRRELSDVICQRLSDLLFTQYENKVKSTSYLYDEVIRHITFREEKLKIYVDRPDIQQKIIDYLSSGSAHEAKTLVIKAESGAGKTALMAWASRWATKNLQAPTVITRFLGTSPQSSDVLSLLQSICYQLLELTYIAPNETAEEQEAKNEDRVIEGKSVAQLAIVMKELMGELSHSKLVIILDSLDQLSPTYGAHLLHWLPLLLPSHVRVIVSLLVPSPGHSSSTDSSMNLSKQLDILSSGPLNECTIRDMGLSIAEEVLQQVLSASQRKIQEAQRDIVLSAFKITPFPLYLQIAATLAIDWQSYTPIDQCILADGMRGIINQIFQKLEGKHGAMLIRKALSYLVESRYGLSNAEMEDVLSCDDEVLKDVYQWWYPPVLRLSPLLWKRVCEDLGPFMVERGVDGATVHSLYHRQFREAARARYITSPEKERQIASHLAAFFNGDFSSPHVIPFTTKDGVVRTEDRLIAPQPLEYAPYQHNLRKLVELPFLQAKSGNFGALSSTLLNFEFIEAKAAAGMLDDLEEDYDVALEAIEKSGKGENVEIAEPIRQFSTFIRKHRHLMRRSPTDTLTFALNQPDSLVVTRMANDQRKKNAVHSQKVIYQHLNKPQAEDPCIMTLQGFAFCVPGQNTIVSAVNDCTLKLWDARTGRLMLNFIGHTGLPHWCFASRDGTKVISGGMDKTIRMWDIQTGRELCVVQKKLELYFAAITSDGTTLIYGSGTSCNTVRDLYAAKVNWEEKTIEDLFKFEITDDVLRIAISPDDKWVAFQSADLVQIYALDSGKFAVKWQSFGAHACKFISNTQLVQQDMSSLRCLEVTEAIKDNDVYKHVQYYCALEDKRMITAYGKFGNTLIAGKDNGMLVICDVEQDSVTTHTLQGHSKSVVQVGVYGKRIISTSSDAVLKVWDLDSSTEIRSHKPTFNQLFELVVIKKEEEYLVMAADVVTMSKYEHNLSIRAWNMIGEEKVKHYVGALGAKQEEPFVTADGKLWFLSSATGVNVFDTSTGKQVNWGKEVGLRASAISPLGTKVVTSRSNRINEIWQLPTYTCIHNFSYHIDPTEWYGFLDEDRLVCVGSDKRSWVVKIINLSTHTFKQTTFTSDGPKKDVNNWENRPICLVTSATIAVIFENRLRVWDDSLNVLVDISELFSGNYKPTLQKTALSDEKIFFARPGGLIHYISVRGAEEEARNVVVSGEIVSISVRDGFLAVGLASRELVFLNLFKHKPKLFSTPELG